MEEQNLRCVGYLLQLRRVQDNLLLANRLRPLKMLNARTLEIIECVF